MAQRADKFKNGYGCDVPVCDSNRKMGIWRNIIDWSGVDEGIGSKYMMRQAGRRHGSLAR